MEQRTRKNGLTNLLALLVAGIAGIIVAGYCGTLAGIAGMIFPGLGILVAAVSWFQMRMEERERLEKLEFDELARTAGGSAMFNADETEVFPAQRSREQFEKFFIPVFTVILFVLQVGGGYLLWHWLQNVIYVPVREPALGFGLFAMFGLVLFLLGMYTTSLSRLENARLLRAGGSYVMLGAFLFAYLVVDLVLVWFGYIHADLYMARALVVVLFLVSIETVINLILELYRPRVKGKVEQPVYESRLVSLLGQPGGLITTAAQTLDYQFGFKVSETWAYRLFAQWLPWLIGGQVAVLLLSTTVVFIDTGEQGVLERFGQPRTVLGPGAHFKLPWPISQVYRYATDRIQSFEVGNIQDEYSRTNKTVLWTVAHTGAEENNFLVANRDLAAVEAGGTNAPADRPPPVSLLTVSIPIQFQITNVLYWAYTNEEPDTLLEHVATREVVRYLASSDLQDMLSQGRSDAGQKLRDRIQDEAMKRNLGVNIVFVGLQDIHPPVKVAADYEKVVAAIHTKEANILNARAGALLTNGIASAWSYKLISEAQSERKRHEATALAQAALFTNQIPAYLASPSVYAERAYLQTMTHSVTNARTYVLLATNTHDVVILNLEDKLTRDIINDLKIPPPKAAK